MLKNEAYKFVLCYMPGVQKKLTNITSFVFYRLYPVSCIVAACYLEEAFF